MRETWHTTARAFQAVVLKGIAQLPMPVDLLAFEVADWEHLTCMKDLARRILVGYDQLSQCSETMIVDAQ